MMNEVIKRLKAKLMKLKMANNKKFHKYTWQQIKVLEARINELENPDNQDIA